MSNINLDNNQLKTVFNICDRTNSGVISVSEFLRLANDHLGPSYEDICSTVRELWKNQDLITYDDFYHTFSPIIYRESTDTSTDPETNELIITGQNEHRKRSRIRHFKDYRSRSKHRQLFTNLCENDTNSNSYFKYRMPEFVGNSASPLKASQASALTSSSPDSGRKSNSGCSSMSDREESYECYGEGDEVDIDFNSSSNRIGDEADGNGLLSPPHSLPPANFSRRNSWVRRSLRCSPSSNVDRITPHRRWGSFRNAPKRVGGTAVASQLYRTSSFSSGRSSVPDQDEMFSDESLEDNVLDLNQKVQMLQKQIGTLGENQLNIDDRYAKTKQENAALHARISMLEEQIRDTETRAEERLSDEQRRNRELISRVEREKQLTVENLAIKQSSTEKERQMVQEENARLKSALEKTQADARALETRVSEAEYSTAALQQENSKITEISKREKEELRIERERSSQVIEELRYEVERLRAVEESFRKRSPSIDLSMSSNSEMEGEIKQLKDANRELMDQVEDLQAQLLTSRLEEGRTLISSTNNNSLAAEFEQMTSDELRGSLKAAQEENIDLKHYIDNILINIVETHPELLEVKHKK